ncbi:MULTISPECIES: terminase large subunit domain-containing protein [Aerococcus]|uniref:terminase large subunit domain-containing protein n=2 Tax=Bacteria TaxID=2 RepID=UPI000DCC613A|nr:MULTISPECIES: terminase large subunit [Aerococcus]KAA9232829.1 terminase large subunit [Aerococcus mictus]MDK6292542.1 terminase large subunit [Aerococcus urinae]MDK6374777.1 terminase large subunit [Aerococcus urinae]MDK6420198.1 terminase large subunit [Aerococcus urinae]MDK8074652.1 terminase large subunit [Aerococcus urinae]
MVTHPLVERYYQLYEDGKIRLNKERVDLLKHLRRDILSKDNVWFDDEKIADCIDFIETNFFPLADFQKFIIPFFFLMINEEGDSHIYYDSFMLTMARGAGKNGLVSGLIAYFISPLYDVRKYNVSIVANSEDQAKVSFDEIYDMLDSDEEYWKQFFSKTKVQIEGLANHSTLRYRTSNANTKDGLRDGLVVFDEYHQYLTNDQLEVFESGSGKVKDYRSIYIGTNGFIRDGVYDSKMEIAKGILSGEDKYTRMFPFICKLDDLDEMAMHDEGDYYMWEKANPMFSHPRTDYAKGLYRQVRSRYYGIRSGQTDKVKFIIKNMNTLVEDMNHTAIPREDLVAATRPYPDTTDYSAIGGCDFAQSRDFTACGVLFMDENGEYIWKHHSFVNANFLRQFTLKAPIAEWETQGLLTIVDEPLIGVDHIVDWFVAMRDENPSLTTIVVDKHKLNTLRVPLEEVGFEVIYIQNPKVRLSMVSDKVDRVFASHEIAWGEDYMMRWYTNNVYVTYDKQGNKIYEKKEEIRRKTDGFMALLYAFAYADTNLSAAPDISLLAGLNF